MGEGGKHTEPKKYSRREALKIGGAAAVGAFGGAVIGETAAPLFKKQPVLPRVIGLIKNAFESKKISAENPKIIETHSEVVALNYILNLQLGSTERRANEENFVNRATSLEQIDHGFFAVSDWQLRIGLLEKRAQLREKGHPELRKLTVEEKDWCKKYKINTEFLAICTDSYFKAREMLTQKMNLIGRNEFLKLYKADLVAMVQAGEFPHAILDKMTIDDMLPNPGTMVGIILHETGAAKPGTIEAFGGVNIGSSPSLKLLRNDGDKDELEDAKAGLKDLYNNLNELSKTAGPIPGLLYNVDQIPGATRTEEGKISGGDIGITQFRPNTAWLLHKFLWKEFKFALHPTSLDSITAAYLFLGRGIAWREKGILYTQSGYINSASRKLDEIPHKEGQLGEIEKWSMEKWNGILASKNLGWGRLYQADITDQGIFSRVLFHYLKRAA